MPIEEFQPSYIADVKDYVLLGNVSNASIARYFGVHENTIARWRKKHPQFDDAITKTKDSLNIEVVKTIYGLALGEYDDGKPNFNALKLIATTHIDSFKEKSSVDVTSNGNTLESMLAIRNTSTLDDDRANGLIEDGEV